MDFQSLVELAPWTTIAQICNLLLQIVLFKKLLFKPIQNILAKRQQEIDSLYDEANKAKLEADTAKADYEQHLSAAKEEAAALRRKAENDIALEKKKAVNDMKSELSGLAVELASKVVRKEISEADHEKLIEQFIDELGDAS